MDGFLDRADGELDDDADLLALAVLAHDVLEHALGLFALLLHASSALTPLRMRRRAGLDYSEDDHFVVVLEERVQEPLESVHGVFWVESSGISHCMRVAIAIAQGGERRRD